MVNSLTKKQRGYVNAKADGKPGVIAVLENYNTTDYNTAAVISSENLKKPNIQAELKELGFDVNNAKQVVGKILNDEKAKHSDRLKAADMVFDVEGAKAPVKTLNANINTTPKELEELRAEYEEKLKAKLIHESK